MRILLALATTCALLVSRASLAEQFHPADVDDLRTDANIVTGLDVSTSMDLQDIEIQIKGMAMAIQAPEILSAITSGRYKRIGFAVFLWAEHSMPVFASWKVIGSPQQAREAADELVTQVREMLRSEPQRLGTLTDVSAALDTRPGCCARRPARQIAQS